MAAKFFNYLRSPAAQQGRINTGMLYIIVIMVILFFIAYLVTGPTPTQVGVNTGTQVTANNAKSEGPKDRLQLYTFGGVSITPPSQGLCAPGGANARPDIILHVSPDHAQGVPATERIRIWVNDDKPLMISPGEVVTRNSGAIVQIGDRAAKAADGYFMEPSLYIFPNSAEAGGQPYFPSNIRGDYNNGAIRIAFGIESLPATVTLKYHYTTEYIWEVKDLNLGPGSYILEFVVMDGTDKHGVKCINMRVFDTPNRRWAIPD